MFGIFASAERKMRENAGNWLEVAEKVYHYRRDVLPGAQLAELQAETAGLRSLVKEKAGVEKLKLGIERLDLGGVNTRALPGISRFKLGAGGQPLTLAGTYF